jgi:hypothetical protein
MFTFNMEVQGLERLAAWLTRAPERANAGVRRGIYRWALDTMNASQEIVPVGGPPTSPYDKTPGALKSSGTVLLPVTEGNVTKVQLGYGGAASAYALRQHEDLTFQHKPGQTAKYLERPILERQERLVGDIADAVQEEG